MSTCANTSRARGFRLPLYAIAALTGAAAHAQQAGDEAAEPAPEAVGAVAVCAVCHGPEGGGHSRLGAPRIGGLADWYVERQLESFRTGIRGGTREDVYGTQMHAVALTLEGDGVIADIADHIASLEPDWPEKTVSGDAERGEQLYAVCTACHGEEGRGSRELNTPSLVGMSDWYLLRQLQYFKDGIRGGNPDDTFGAQMVPIMTMFETRQDLVDLVAYINTFPQAPQAESDGSSESSESSE